MAATHILVRSLITEKATRLSEVPAPPAGKEGGARGPVYSFLVAEGANKFQIRQAVEAHFNVAVKAVHTQILPGKLRRRGAQTFRRPPRKKALVRLAAGQSIDLFPQEG